MYAINANWHFRLMFWVEDFQILYLRYLAFNLMYLTNMTIK